MKVNVLVIEYQGIIDDVKVFKDGKAADTAHKQLILEDYDTVEDYESAVESGQAETEYYLFETDVIE